MNSEIELRLRLDLLTNVLRFTQTDENRRLMPWNHRVAINMERAAIIHALDEMKALKADFISLEYKVPQNIESKIEAIERIILMKNQKNGQN